MGGLTGVVVHFKGLIECNIQGKLSGRQVEGWGWCVPLEEVVELHSAYLGKTTLG